MAKGESLRKKEVSARKPANQYDYLKEMVNIAKKNGWDLEGLGLITKDLPKAEVTLTKKQAGERNQIIKSILQRFAKILTPPVPSEVEQYIRNKREDQWLPWEKEAMERLDHWRAEVNTIKPELLEELRMIFSGIQ